MVNWIKRYWVELLTFGAISGVLFLLATPDITWINTDSDGVHYIYAAEYLYPAHKSSAPLYLLLSNIFLRLPFGTEAWRMALISVLSGIVGGWLIYLTIRHLTKENKLNRLFGIAGALVYGSSALAISQNTIVETYPLVTTVSLGIYYFALKGKWKLSALMIGIAGAIHPLSLLVSIPLLIVYKELRQWKQLAIAGIFVLFYLYIPLTNRSPYMWNAPNEKGLGGFLVDTFATAQMLSGGLSIWDFPKRVIDTILQLGLSWNIGIVILVMYFWKVKWYKELLCWLIILPIVYYATNLAPQTYVYMQPSIAFGAIAIGIGLSKIRFKYTGGLFPNEWTKLATYGVIGVSSIMLVVNANYFDIGRTLDKNLSARQFYNNELSKVPDGQILLAQQGWEWAMVYPYNKNEGRNIIPINPGSLASPKYQDILHSWGIKFDVPKERVTLVELQDYIVKEILKQNENIWITVPVESRTYGAEIVSYKGNEDKLEFTPKSITDGSMDMVWKWKPYNPYDITTGAIEIDEWIYIVFSNYTVLAFTMMGMIGVVPMWIGYMLVVKRKRWSFRKAVSARI